MTVEWPDERSNVKSALEALAAAPVVDEVGRDPRWPALTEAIHWLVDDTGWDLHDPAGSIGRILSDAGEAAAIHQVVRAVMVVADRHGPLASDAVWFADIAWPEVRARASAALDLLNRA